MKKQFLFIGLFLTVSTFVFAQSDEDFFSDDDLFFEDAIIEEVTQVEAKTDLAKGILFEDGSVRIGGSFTSAITTQTTVYNEADEDDGVEFSDNLKNTALSPDVSALFTLDARPSQDLRMYSKIGFRYPFCTTAASSAQTSAVTLPAAYGGVSGAGGAIYNTNVTTSVTDWIYLKELFTDFSLADRVFFRFGLHTVTWGAGYFYSPVSDIINTSSINPEDVDAQVDGCLNLRTQITFPGTQNCLWLYVIPAFDYAKNSAFAGKFDLVLGGWELGAGGYWKNEAAPKVTLTASGSLGKINLFGEGVYQYGSDRQWNEKFDEKTNLFKATAGFSYTWKDPSITLAAQYLYDGNDFVLSSADDMQYFASNPMYIKENLTQGHNVAALLNFGRIFGTTDVTATVFAMANFGKEDLPDTAKSVLTQYGAQSYLNAGTFSAMLYYAPTDAITLGMGPYITFADFENAPLVSLKLSFTLGGGNF